MIDLLRRAWDALDSFKQTYPENWHEEDEQVMKDLMRADLKMSCKGTSMTKDEALKMALDFIEKSEGGTADLEAHIKEALAQPQQEPWSRVSIGVDMTEKGAHVIGIYAMTDDTSQVFYAKHYPAPQRTWVSLTDEEMHECWGDPLTPLGMKHARMIEAKLKEKNT